MRALIFFHASSSAFIWPSIRMSTVHVSLKDAVDGTETEEALMARLGFSSFGKKSLTNAGGHVVRSATDKELTVLEQHKRYDA